MLETPRLSLRLVSAQDFDFIFAMQSDPVTMRYIRKAETDPEVVRERLAMYVSYAADHPGLGVVIAESKADGTPVGYAVLRHADFTPGNDIEVGYGLPPAQWGLGYATEISEALIAYAFSRFDIPLVCAFTDPANTASNRVLEKCGFQQAGRRVLPESESIRWEKQRPPHTTS